MAVRSVKEGVGGVLQREQTAKGLTLASIFNYLQDAVIKAKLHLATWTS